MSSPAASSRRTLTLTCVGFDWRAEVSLKETLALLRGKTYDLWQYSDEPGADVVIYDGRNLLAQAMVRRGSESGGHQVFFNTAGDDDGELSLRYPFGASRLVRCLDHASLRLTANAGTALAGDGDSLCQRLDDALQLPGTTAIAITAGGQTGLLKPAEQRVYWPQPMGLDETARLLAGSVEVQVLGPGERGLLQRLESQATAGAPAEGLLWAIGIARSRGMLLNRIDSQRLYRLRRWPNFGVIGRRGADLRCASLLIQRELSHTGLARTAGMPASVVVSFINACAVCGLLVEGPREAAATATSSLPSTGATTPSATAGDSRLGGMLRRLRQVFALDRP